MAKPYREGSGWSIRMRVRGHEIYLSGYASETAARKEADKQRHTIENIGKPVGLGPLRTRKRIVSIAFYVRLAWTSSN